MDYKISVLNEKMCNPLIIIWYREPAFGILDNRLLLYRGSLRSPRGATSHRGSI